MRVEQYVTFLMKRGIGKTPNAFKRTLMNAFKRTQINAFKRTLMNAFKRTQINAFKRTLMNVFKRLSSALNPFTPKSD